MSSPSANNPSSLSDLSRSCHRWAELHTRHKQRLERYLETIAKGPIGIISIAPTTMGSLLSSTSSNPRTPYAIIQALETHMQECIRSYQRFEVPDIQIVAREQDAFTDKVDFVIQTLTRILPIKSVST